MAIISNVRKAGQNLNLLSLRVDIEDSSFLSEYFILSEYNPKFTAGKNTFLLNGSPKLASNTSIQIEVLDVFGNSLYVEIAKTNEVAYREGGAVRISVYVYSDTPYGVGKIIIVSREKVTNKLIRWIGNIQINPTVQNTSKVTFYNPPGLSVVAAQVPISVDRSSGFIQKVTSATIQTNAITPKKGDDYGLFDASLTSIDYRLSVTDPGLTISSSMKNSFVDLYITKLDGVDGTLNITSSNVIVDIIDEKTVKLKTPIYYVNNQNKKIVANISEGKLNATFTGVIYDSKFTAGSAYYQSIASIEYTNLKTFSGNVYRHKLYRRSLSSAGDFEIIADEPIVDSDVLIDRTTPNSFFKSLGSFPNADHVNHYWFRSSTDLTLERDGLTLMDSIKITNPTISDHYIIVKNDTKRPDSATYNYTNYDEQEFINESGKSYDSNFMSFYPDVTYQFSFKCKVVKNTTPSSYLTKPASVSFYITSSMYQQINGDANFDNTRGIKIGEVYLNENSSSAYYLEPLTFYSKFKNEFNGTMLIYTNNCTANISEMKLTTYSEPSFSPDIFLTRVPFPVNVAGEQFELKSELFDVNSNLVYSDLRTICTFDPSGSSLNKIIPGIISSDSTNGLKVFNLIIETSQTNPAQGLFMKDSTKFEFDSSGSAVMDSEFAANFYVKKGVVSLSPVRNSDGSCGTVYIQPHGRLKIYPYLMGFMDRVTIGQTTAAPGKFTDLTATTITATTTLTIPTTTSPATVSSTVTSTTLASTPGTVNVVCPLRAPDGWLEINGKKVPYYN